MRITKKLQIVPLAALSLGIASLCFAQSDAPYTEGPVWNITMVKTKSGMTDEYLKGLAKTLKGTLEEAKKQNEKFDPIARKVVGTTDQQQAMAVKRLDIREIVGTKLMREITLK
jgi:hypothetical protein